MLAGPLPELLPPLTSTVSQAPLQPIIDDHVIQFGDGAYPALLEPLPQRHSPRPPFSQRSEQSGSVRSTTSSEMTFNPLDEDSYSEVSSSKFGGSSTEQTHSYLLRSSDGSTGATSFASGSNMPLERRSELRRAFGVPELDLQDLSESHSAVRLGPPI